MSKKSKTRRRQRKKLRKLEERSDRRTAEFLVARLDELKSDLGDLIPDLQAYDHYCEIMQLSWCVRVLGELRKKYQKHADGHPWEDS